MVGWVRGCARACVVGGEVIEYKGCYERGVLRGHVRGRIQGGLIEV